MLTTRKHHADDHYRKLYPQPIDVIDSWGLGYKAGNVLKYIARAEHKGQRVDDYKKALEYLKMLLAEEKEYQKLCLYPPKHYRLNTNTWDIPWQMQSVIEALELPRFPALEHAIKTMDEWVKAL